MDGVGSIGRVPQYAFGPSRRASAGGKFFSPQPITPGDVHGSEEEKGKGKGTSKKTAGQAS
jgi:hypothetical protein